MKTSYAALFLALSATAAFGQKIGDTVTPETLGKIEWVKGEAPKTWEPGKVYILECWATWCGPCLAAIPHVDALYDKYQEKGLRVIGVNVWEDGKDKVEKFVKDKGDGMSYPIAYTGKGGAFETEWLKPAGVNGIPHAFIVKDGKVVLTSHPAQLSEEIIEGLLAGGDAQTKALDGIKKKQESAAKMNEVFMKFRKASAAKDPAGMETALGELTALDPESRNLAPLKVELSIAKEDWSAAEAQITALHGNPALMTVLLGAARNASGENVPAGFRKTVATELASTLETMKQPALSPILARLQWGLGEKEAATATAKKGLEDAKEVAAKNPRMQIAPFEKFAAAVEKGEMPTEAEFGAWAREAAPAPANAVAPAVPSVPAVPVKPTPAPAPEPAPKG